MVQPSAQASIRIQKFAARVCQHLSEMNGVKVHETSNHFQAQSTLDNIVEASGVLNTLAVSLMKIANDIRWLGSGPEPVSVK